MKYSDIRAALLDEGFDEGQVAQIMAGHYIVLGIEGAEAMRKEVTYDTTMDPISPDFDIRSWSN